MGLTPAVGRPVEESGRTKMLVSPYTVDMPINDLLLTEFDEEVKKTRTTLERVPTGKGDFVPHPKSMPLGKLAPHIAQLGGFGLTILTEPGLDFSQRRMTPLPWRRPPRTCLGREGRWPSRHG